MGLALAEKFSRAAGSSDSGEGPFSEKLQRGYYLGGDWHPGDAHQRYGE